nr:hypothetical protein [Tanacetum cinerariifolium]
TIRTHDDEVGSSRSKRSRQHKTVEEATLLRVHHQFLLWEGCNRAAKTYYNAKLAHLLPKPIYSPTPILRVLQKMITYDLCQKTTGYDKVQKNELWLMSMFKAKHQNSYENVAWLMEKCLKRKGVGSQKDSMICCGQLITKMAKMMRLLTDEVLNSLSALTYYRALDTTTLRELIDSKGRFPDVPASGVPRVDIPRGPRPSMPDLYDQMGSMEIRQGAIERMAYRQSYH